MRLIQVSSKARTRAKIQILKTRTAQNKPYILETYEHDYGLDFDENLSGKEKNKLHNIHKVLTSATFTSHISFNVIMQMIEYYNLQEKWHRLATP